MYDCPTRRQPLDTLGATNSAVAAGACGFVIPTCGCAQSTALGVVRAAPRIIPSGEWGWRLCGISMESICMICFIHVKLISSITWTWTQTSSILHHPVILFARGFAVMRQEFLVLQLGKTHFCGPIEIWHLICSFPNVNTVGASPPADFGLRM